MFEPVAFDQVSAHVGHKLSLIVVNDTTEIDGVTVSLPDRPFYLYLFCHDCQQTVLRIDSPLYEEILNETIEEQR